MTRDAHAVPAAGPHAAAVALAARRARDELRHARGLRRRGRRRGRRHPSPGRCVMSGTRMVSERDVGFVGPGGSARAVFTLAIDDL